MIVRKRSRLVLGVLGLFFALLAGDLWSADKRIAILYVEDKSGFDAPQGCGLLPLGPFSRLFGRTRRQREYWNLEVGFREMLAETLRDAPGYALVTPDEVMVVFAESGTQRRDLRRADVRAQLADRLNANALLALTIRTFKQERMRGVIQRDISGQRGQAQFAGGLATSVGAAGSFHKAIVVVDVTAYGITGEEAFVSRISASDTYQGASVMSGPLEATVSGEGATAYIGEQKIIQPAKKPPTVRFDVLDRVKFGTPGWDAPSKEGGPPTYRETLLGRVTQKVMDDTLTKLRDRIGPALEEVKPTASVSAATGKIILIQEETGDLYVNLGTTADVRPGQRLRVFRAGEEIQDPDTGEALGAIESEVGIIEIVEVLRPRWSKARRVSGEAQVKDVVKTTPVTEPPKTE